MGMNTAPLEDAIRDVGELLAERDAYDGWMLAVSIAAAVVTGAAVIIALVTSSQAERSAGDSLAIAEKAAEAAEKSAKAAADMLAIEQLRLGDEQRERRREGATLLVEKLTQLRTWMDKTPGAQTWQDRHDGNASHHAAVVASVETLRLVAVEDAVAMAMLEAMADAVEAIVELQMHDDAPALLRRCIDLVVGWHGGREVEKVALDVVQVLRDAAHLAALREEKQREARREAQR